MKTCISWLKANALLVIAVMALSAFLGVRNMVRSTAVKPFAAHLGAYIDIPDLKRDANARRAELDSDDDAPLEPRQGSSPSIAGKFIAINKADRKVDDLYFDLPKEVRASTPEEVGTVIWLAWKEKSAGIYTDGAGAYQVDCDVTVIDNARAAVVDERTFHGSRPPSAKKGGGSRTGSKPTDEIVGYLTNLLAGIPRPDRSRRDDRAKRFTAAARSREQNGAGFNAIRPAVFRTPSRPESNREPLPVAPAPLAPPRSPAPSRPAQATVELTGVLDLFGKKKALLEITEPGLGSASRKVTLQEGDRVNSIEVVNIDVAKGRVGIRNAGTESVLRLKTPQSGVVAAGYEAGGARAAVAANWPGYSGELRGDLELTVKNPNEFNVRVGLRSAGKGKDFFVPAHGTQSVFVPGGHYTTHFQYSTDPQGLYQGDSFHLFNRGAQITITKVVNGNYGIRKVN